MQPINIQYYKTEIGELIIGSHKDKLCLLNYRNSKSRKRIDKRIQKQLKSKFKQDTNNSDSIVNKTKKQIDLYLSGEIATFDIPTILIGTKFQKTVWNALLKVPYGKTLSYLDLAKNINNRRAVRAVANANGANPIAIIYPCHRIISHNGSIGGYGGGLNAKKRLLNLEKYNSSEKDQTVN